MIIQDATPATLLDYPPLETHRFSKTAFEASIEKHDIEDQGLESLTPEEAIRQMEELEKEGAVHTIWTMMTPFIGAICNCQPEDCLGLRTLSIDVETMFRGEMMASVDEEQCTGCGLCRNVCPAEALSLVRRE